MQFTESDPANDPPSPTLTGSDSVKQQAEPTVWQKLRPPPET